MSSTEVAKIGRWDERSMAKALSVVEHDANATDLLRRLIHYDPAVRCNSIRDILEHPFFSGPAFLTAGPSTESQRQLPALPAPAPAPVQEDFFADAFGPPSTSVGQPAPSPAVRGKAQVNDPFAINPSVSEGNTTVGSTPTMNSPTSIGQENRENGSQKRVVVDDSPASSPKLFPSSSKSSKSASFSQQQPVKSKSRRKGKSSKYADDDERSVSTFKSFRKGLSKKLGKSKSFEKA
jgi:hypothetical protein